MNWKTLIFQSLVSGGSLSIPKNERFQTTPFKVGAHRFSDNLRTV
jgi:hypothetical protein